MTFSCKFELVAEKNTKKFIDYENLFYASTLSANFVAFNSPVQPFSQFFTFFKGCFNLKNSFHQSDFQ